MIRSTLLRLSACTVAAGAGLALAGAAAAQPGYYYTQPRYTADPAYADGVTVYGRRARRDEQQRSEAVSYRDLDLATKAGQDALNWRVAESARALCDELGEAPEHYGNNGSVFPTCQATARASAFTQVRDAVRDARYRAYDYPARYEAGRRYGH